MSEHDPSDELINRIFSYMARAAKDPGIVNRQPGEFDAIVSAWRLLSISVPGLLPFGAEEFQRYVITNGTKAAAEAFLASANKRVRPVGPLSNSRPSSPPANASATQMAQFNKSLAKYNRMFEMMSKIMQNQHEMKKSIIGNLR